ncbi:MAG: hypothetical protein FJ100_04155 [Deltaproteobacteria bacterium]|nr:hypothetical protein [Deltaproteobacteria bacterium]
MAESIVLLVGGTKMLERELQTAIAAPLVAVATMEEATKVWNARPVRLVVLGPTLRRALQVVTMLRSDGNQDSQILVVFRDDQRDEVKRHQKGKAVADAYVAQSRIQRELADAATRLWATLATGEHDLVEELPAEAVADSQDGATQLMDVVTLGEDEEEPPPPPDDLGDVEVLGALDLQEVDAGDELIEVIALDDVAVEEVADGEPAAASQDGVDRETAPEEAPMVVMTMENSILEELPSDDELDAKVAPPAAPNGASADALDLEEIDLSAELIEELAVDDAMEDIVDADLVQELHEHLEAEQPQAPSVAQPAVAPEMPTSALAPAASARTGPESAAVLPMPAFSAPSDTAPKARQPDSVGPATVAATWAPNAEVAPAAPQASPTAVTQPAKASGAHAAMFSELTTFVERLQDAANSIARLEAENEHLRAELAHAQAAARPELDAELTGLRSQLDELRLRLSGSDHARDAAVEARMRAEQAAAAREDDLTSLRHEVAAAHGALATANAGIAAMQGQLATVEAQAEARRRIQADAARSLYAVAAMLEG